MFTNIVETNQFADVTFDEFKSIYLMDPQVTHIVCQNCVELVVLTELFCY